MPSPQSTLRIALGAALLASLVLLVVVVAQNDSLERRLVRQTQQIRVLGEATERVAGELKRLESGGAASREDSGCTLERVIHPELNNWLGAPDTRWPPEGASLDGVFKRGWSRGDLKGYNPIIENAGDLSELIVNYTDRGLAARNAWTDPNRWHGELACRIEVSEDFKTYTIYLRKGVMWHRPSAVDLSLPRYAWLAKDHPMTAADFVFSLDMLLSPQVENGFVKNYYQDLDGYEALDDHTLVVRWKKKTYQSLDATLGLGPLPQFLYGYSEEGTEYPKTTVGLKLNQHWYNNKGYVGVGPYRMVEYTPGTRIVLERNDDFYGAKPAIRRIVYPIYTDSALTPLKLRSGEVNFGELSPSQYREEVLEPSAADRTKRGPFLDGTLRCEPVLAPVYRYIGWNGDKPLFADPKVRTAMTLAFNRQGILDKVFLGLGELVSGPFLPSSGALDPSIPPLPFDLGRARELLGEAGWRDTDGDGLIDKVVAGARRPFEFTLLIYGGKVEYSALANIFKEDLLKIGVKMNVTGVEWSLMQKRMDEKNFDAFTGGWGLSWDPDPFQIWHSSQADVPRGSNRVGFRNPEADRLIEQLRETFEPAERRAKFHALHRILNQQMPYSSFMVQKYVYCWSKAVRDVSFAKVQPIADAHPWWVQTAE